MKNSFSTMGGIAMPTRRFLLLFFFTLPWLGATCQWTTSGNNIYNSNTGNVGIGTTAPTNTLEVNGGITSHNTIELKEGDLLLSRTDFSFGYVIRPNSPGVKNLQFAVAGGGPLDNLVCNSAMSYFTGTVGIGTLSPVASLDVFWPASSTLQKGLFLHSGSFGTGANAQSSYFLKAQDDGNGATQFIVHGDGSVGIMTDVSPGYSLSVNGAGIFTKVVVKSYADWPDYVFGSKYRLPSLGKVEKYIKDKHHLPDIPSAESIAKSGVDIGAGQAALLKKIEELMLYVIDLNKSLDELKGQLKAQQVQIGRLEQTANRAGR